MAAGKIRVGLSGWSYRHWRGDFYPEGLPHSEELAFVTRQFSTVEINGTFYSLTTPKAARYWYETAPDGFVYAVKGSRFITHNKKLGDAEEPLANFCASGILELREKLGPILWQLGPDLHFDPERVDRFLTLLPRDLKAMAVAARTSTLDRPSSTELIGENHRVRHVIEPRHESFFVPEMAALAHRHHVAIAFSHSSVWPYIEEVTTDFVYLRLHGPRALYDSAYSPAEMRRWAERARVWSEGSEPEDAVRIAGEAEPRQRRDVYVYFDNDGGGHAPRQAEELIDMLT
jgi:uncharacterized protein YecE (DUF72 family)